MQSRLQNLRKSRGVGQQRLADDLNAIVGNNTPTTTRLKVANWEAGRSDIPQYMLPVLATYFDVTIDYLLGHSTTPMSAAPGLSPLAPEELATMKGQPVFLECTAHTGWALVSLNEMEYITPSGIISAGNCSGSVYAVPPMAYLELRGAGNPLTVAEVGRANMVWVEPIGTDAYTNAQLRGWYSVAPTYVENEIGQKFYHARYGVSWLAYEDCLP